VHLLAVSMFFKRENMLLCYVFISALATKNRKKKVFCAANRILKFLIILDIR